MKRPPQTPRKPLDYSKAKEVQGKTREQLLSEGYTEQVKDGKTYFSKQSESSTPPSVNIAPVRQKMTKAPVVGSPKPVRRTPPPTPGTETDSQEIVYLNTPPPKTLTKNIGVNSDVSVRGEEKRTALGTNMYSISYPDTKGGGGMSKATTEIFNNDPKKGAIGAHISGFDANGSPIFSGKTQNDFTPQNQGSLSLMSNDVNKNSLDYQLSNSKQPVETTGNKYQEIGANSLNAPAIDKKDQGIGTGLMDIEKLPTTELNKRPDVINVPKFNKGGGIYKMKRPPKYRKG
jgi:hypothetical protein